MWQKHKDQLGREAGQDAGMSKVSIAFKDATAAHMRTYAAQTLEELAVETGEPEKHLHEGILAAFNKLSHSMVCHYYKQTVCTERCTQYGQG